MIKIDLITGFLGSGKTTFLKKFATYLLSQGLNICILENDYGAVNVDMMLLQDLICDNCCLEMVAGGCDIECHKRRFKTKLIAMGMKKYDRVIIEPSGIFDTDEFFDSLYDEPLSSWYEIGNVFTIVDSKNLVSDPDSKYILASEVAHCGKVLLSKFDENTNTDSIINYLDQALKDIGCNNKIDNKIFAKDWSRLDASDFASLINSGYCDAAYNKRMVSSYSSMYFMNKSYDYKKINDVIKELFNNSIYGNVIRLKGFYYENNKWYQVNATKNEMNIMPIANGQNVIIVIGNRLEEEELNRLLNYVIA